MIKGTAAFLDGGLDRMPVGVYTRRSRVYSGEEVCERILDAMAVAFPCAGGQIIEDLDYFLIVLTDEDPYDQPVRYDYKLQRTEIALADLPVLIDRTLDNLRAQRDAHLYGVPGDL